MTAGRRGLQAPERRRRRHRRHLRHGRRLRALLPRRDRPLERVAADQGRGGGDLRGERRRVRRVPGRERRAHDRRQHGERLGDLPHRRAAEHDLEAGLEGRRTGTRSTPRSPTCRSSSSARARTRARSTTSPTRSTARRARAAPTTRRARTTTSSCRASPASEGGLGYFGFSYFEENQDTLKAVEVDGGDGCVAPSVAIGAGRHLHAALAAALRLRQASSSLAESEDLRTSSGYMLENEQTIAEEAQFVPLNQEQLDEQLQKLEDAPRSGVGRRRRRAPARRAAEEARPAGASRLVQGILFLARGDLRRSPRSGSSLSLLLPARRVLPRGQPGRVPHRDDLGAAVRARALRRRAARRRHASMISFWALARRVPARRSASAIYLSEYASPRVTRRAQADPRDPGGDPDRRATATSRSRSSRRCCATSGSRSRSSTSSPASLVIGVMLIPTIASLSEDAMSAVPRDLRDGAYAPRRRQAAGLDPRRRSRGDLRDHRRVRARRLARGRRDDDRPDRGGAACRRSRSTRARRSRR